MLDEGDLARFIEYFRDASAQREMPAEPASVLKAEKGLFPAEIDQLARSLAIAAALGDAERSEAVTASIIARQVSEFRRCVDLSNARAWRQAIAWVLSQPGLVENDINPASVVGRPEQVGQACRRLRKERYQVSVNARGVLISDQSEHAIFEQIDRLIAHIGGTEAVMQICRIMEDSKLSYDGMWLLGDRVPGIMAAKRPAFPVGWLFSVGLRHLGRGGNARKPATAWSTIVQLATDFAAAMDCQRYSQFEEIDIHAAQSWRSLRDALLWREVFVLPQVSSQVIPMLREAFETLISPAEKEAFDWDLMAGFAEVENLLSRSPAGKVTILPRLTTAQRYPNLWKIGVGEIGKVNAAYTSPMKGGERNQSNFIFFACGPDQVLTLPAPLLREAFCQAAFLQIWRKLPREPDRASEVVGKIFERSLARACEGKAAHIYPAARYQMGKYSFEIDVGTRDKDCIVLFETKGKSLTARSRSGDMMAFYADYTESYLKMVHQLVRHEDHLRQGLTSLTTTEESFKDLRPLKVAVSPLSYGPVSDKVLASSIIRSFANMKLQPLSSEGTAKSIVDKFNKAVERIYERVFRLAPKTEKDEIDLFAYFLDVFWVDLGQALYALDRANTVADAFIPLKFVTFSTRDFWTEIAFSDAEGLIRDRWRPLTV